MLNDDIFAIKDSILDTVGKDCERTILFGSTPMEYREKAVLMMSLLSLKMILKSPSCFYKTYIADWSKIQIIKP